MSDTIKQHAGSLAKTINELETTIAQQRKEIFRLRTILDNLPGSIYWKTSEGVYLGRNNFAAEQMVVMNIEPQLNKTAPIGKTDYDFFSKDIADMYRQHDQQVMESGKQITTEEPVDLPNGQRYVYLSTKTPLRDINGRVEGIIGNTVDITHLKKIEANLVAAKEQAEEANNIKTEFIRNMEHDIRTPFNGVLGISRFLYENETDPDKKTLLNDVVHSSAQLLEYFNNILEYSKIQMGMVPVLEKKISVIDLVEQVVGMEAAAVKHKKLELNVDIADDIPLTVIGDQYRLYGILINLLSNAIKFTPRGSVNFQITKYNRHAIGASTEVNDKPTPHLSKAITHNEQVVLRFVIKDTGVGIPEDKIQFVYEKFAKVEAQSQGAHRGLGLGLRVVKQFVAELHGEIDVTSQVGCGTTFVCTIPFNLPLVG